MRTVWSYRTCVIIIHLCHMPASTNNYISCRVALQSSRSGRVSVSENEIQLRASHTHTHTHTHGINLPNCFGDNRTEPVTKRRVTEIRTVPYFFSFQTYHLFTLRKRLRFVVAYFWALSRICENRLLTSSYQSVCPSVEPSA